MTHKYLKYRLVPFFILFLISNIIFKTNTAFAFTIESPSILDIKNVTQHNTTNYLYVRGTTPNRTKILVYIDGIYNGNAQIQQNNNGKLNIFEYYSQNPLKKGKHEIKIIAESTILLSMSSPIIQIITMYNQPQFQPTKNTDSLRTTQTTSHKPSTPEISTPKNNQTFERNWIIVSGLTDNNTKINIFLNKKLIAHTNFLTDNSGTANFRYKIDNLQGNNSIYVQSETKNGTLSAKSQIIYFKIKKHHATKKTTIIPVKMNTKKKATTTKKDIVLEPKITISTPQNNAVIVNKFVISGQIENVKQIEIFIDNKMVQKIKNKNQLPDFSYTYNKNLNNGMHTTYVKVKNKDKIKESDHISFIIADINKIKNNTTATNNSKNNNKTATSSTTTNNTTDGSSNKVIFALFLLAIIIWIIVINKELIVEKIKKRDKKDKD